MNYKFLFPALTAVFILNSCSKDDIQDNSSVEKVTQSFQTSNILEIEQTALYTKHGIETNPSVIAAYLQRNFSDPAVQNRFLPNGKTVEVPGSGLALQFLENGAMRVNGENVVYARTTDEIMWLTEEDDEELPIINNSASGILLEKVPQVTPNNSHNGDSQYTFKRSYPFHMYSENTYVPVIYYAGNVWVSELVNGVEVKSNNAMVTPHYPEYNVTNASLRGEMNEGDTLVIQTGRLPMVKRS